MSRAYLSLTAALFLVAVPTARAEDDKKTDLQTPIAEGKEIALTPVTVTVSDMPGTEGVYLATIKPVNRATKVKMPIPVYGLAFYSKPVKGGLEVVEVPETSSLRGMRTMPGKADEVGDWSADPGDIITHVNGHAVTTVEELLAATSTAKDKNDIQIVLKDMKTGDMQVFYITATKK